MNLKEHLFFIGLYLFIFLFCHHQVLFGWRVLHWWQVIGQQEYVSTATLETYQDTMEYRTNYYTIQLNGNDDAPNLNLVHEIFYGDADSTTVDYEKVWNALDSVPIGSSVPVKWVNARNGYKVFTEINGSRKIGGYMFGFYHFLGLFLWFYFGITYIYIQAIKASKKNADLTKI